MHFLTPVVAVLLVLAVWPVSAQTMYRYKDADGKIVYTDRVPAPDQKVSDLEQKQTGGNYVETDKIPFQTQDAMLRYPVTLYTSPCGDPCQKAEDLLRKRGIPFTSVNVSQPEGRKKLSDLTGGTKVPVLQIGSDQVVGFEENDWNGRLTQAGYDPKDAGVHSQKSKSEK